MMVALLSTISAGRASPAARGGGAPAELRQRLPDHRGVQGHAARDLRPAPALALDYAGLAPINLKGHLSPSRPPRTASAPPGPPPGTPPGWAAGSACTPPAASSGR